MVRDPDRCPTHPGVFLREMVIPHVDATKTEIAEALGISRQQFYDVLNGKQPITPKTAVRLERVIGRSAQAWLNMQNSYDVWNATQSLSADLERLQKLPKVTADARNSA